MATSKNKWAIKVIPKEFTDVDYIFEEVLFAGLINFWENDNGETTMRYQWEGGVDDFFDVAQLNYNKLVYETMLAAYDWAKARHAAYNNPSFNYKHKEKYIEQDTEHLTNIIKYRRYLWS